MTSYWRQLLDGAAPIRLYTKPGIEYNMGNLETFLFDQAGGAATTWIRIYGIEKFQQRLQSTPKTLNPKYENLINQYQSFMKGG